MLFGVLYFRTSTGANISTNIDNVDGICHIYLPLVHIVQHLLGPGSPYLIVTRMAEETDTDDDIAFESETFLCLKELFFEASATAESNDRESTYHIIVFQSSMSISH